jgi:hypothetical protein
MELTMQALLTPQVGQGTSRTERTLNPVYKAATAVVAVKRAPPTQSSISRRLIGYKNTDSTVHTSATIAMLILTILSQIFLS